MGKSWEFICPALDKIENLLWWLEIMFRVCENVKILRIYRFDHNPNVTQVIHAKVDKNVKQRSKIYM